LKDFKLKVKLLASGEKFVGYFGANKKTTWVKNLKQRFVDLIFLLKKERNNYYMLDLQGWSMMFEV